MNSVIQAFSSLERFTSYLKQNDIDGPISQSLLSISNMINRGKRSCFSPTKLTRAITRNGKNHHLLGYHQQDAHEFFQVVSSLVSDEEPAPLHRAVCSLFDMENLFLPEKLSALFLGKQVDFVPIENVRNPFTGLLASRIKCLSCGHLVVYV
jgi:ubiquitin carboxyl-terminal hydrolase 1